MVLPDPLATLAQSNLQRFRATLNPSLEAEFADMLAGAGLGPDLRQVFATSDYVAAVVSGRPDMAEWFIESLRSGTFEKAFSSTQLDHLIATHLESVGGMDALLQELRRVRSMAQIHIIWRDFVAREYHETVAATTLLADRLIDFALNRLHGWLVEQMGEPLGADGVTPQRMVVFALGKLGACELNLSSDVDLLFGYPEAGRVRGSNKVNQAFFLRLSQQLVQALDNLTADGFAFRVDMRLRPYGESGALVMHFGALERYYEEQGRSWERYALIRARVCAGDQDSGAHLLATLRPFVYRRYLDFGAIDSLREMKKRVDQERSAEAFKDNIKLGPGGIRDVEFIVQMRQLIWGGRHPELRIGRTLEALEILGALDLVSEPVCRSLADAYVFLRDVEHKLQGFHDRQTQMLPGPGTDRARLTWLMGFEDYDALLECLNGHRRRVAEAFVDVVRQAAPADQDQNLWEADAEDLAGALTEANAADSEAAVTAVSRLRRARDRSAVAQEGRDRLDALMPDLLQRLRGAGTPGVTLERTVPLLEAVLRRSAYLVLLAENPGALALLLEICGSSRWMASELARHPALLDDLLDQRGLFELPSRSDLAAELAVRLERCRDGEEQQEALSAFKQSHSFRCAACELRGSLPLMNVSDYLTFVAEVVVEGALDVAWRATVADRGEPEGGRRPIVVVGYGKLGGLELGPDSDLDLVFIHDLAEPQPRFLHRFARRLLNLLTAQTYSGALYEVDIRLRPDGRSGMIISSLDGFEQYQTNDAWMWEHQALVRARPVAGDLQLAEQFVALRRRLLCQPRDRRELAAAVVEMRGRIDQAATDDADLKRGAGGIVDIEFMVQYLVLAWASEHPELCEFTDNVRILEVAARAGLLSEAQRVLLTDAYLALRAERHRGALDIPDDERARDVLQRYRDGVREIWHKVFDFEEGHSR